MPGLLEDKPAGKLSGSGYGFLLGGGGGGGGH